MANAPLLGHIQGQVPPSPVQSGSTVQSSSSSGTQSSQVWKFQRKVCTRFFPSDSALQEYKKNQHLNQNYSRENISCICGLLLQDHEKDDSGDGPAQSVKQMFKGEISIKEFEEREKKNIKCGLDYLKCSMKEAEHGVIEFWMDHGLKSESKFARLSDTKEESDLKDFLKDYWNFLTPRPELIISLLGTTTNKKLADSLVDSIIKISRYMNLIILTSGLESDPLAKKVGDAVRKEQKWTTEMDFEERAKAKIKCIGITTWGTLKEKPVFVKKSGRQDFYEIGTNKNAPGHEFVLNPDHSFFLLLDTGTTLDMRDKLNNFLAETLKKLKDNESLNSINLILGESVGQMMATSLLDRGFPVVFLRNSVSYLDVLIDGLLSIQQEKGADVQSIIGSLKEKLKNKSFEKFWDQQVKRDYYGQLKNVMIVCDLMDSSSSSSNSGVSDSLESAIVKSLILPLLVRARLNKSSPDRKAVLQILELAAMLDCWDTWDDLLAFQYEWDNEEKETLKDIFKKCLLRDRPEAFLLPISDFMKMDTLSQLYSKDVISDPLQAVFKRRKFIGTENKSKPLEEMVQKFKLPDCYLPVLEEGSQDGSFKYSYKELLIWAVLSKKWRLVQHILYSEKNNSDLVWFLASAYLCKSVAARQQDVEIQTEFKQKQRFYEECGKTILETLTVQHGSHITENGNRSKPNYTNMSLEMRSVAWGDLCPADLALLGNFKTFVRSEGFHNYVVQRWKRKNKDDVCCLCETRVKFHIHWFFYMVMVMTFCAAVISRVQHGHFAYQICLMLWIFTYILGEIITGKQQQRNFRLCPRWYHHWWITRKKYLLPFLLACFLVCGLVCSFAGYTHWGGMLYGVASLILIFNISNHFLSSYRLFAPQISILKKALKEVFTFMVLIILLIWSVSMIFNPVLCLNDKIMNNQTNTTGKTSGSWTNMFHSAWFLYLALYGEYSFELDLTDEGNFSCVENRSALMWVSYILIGLHILIGNVLLMNLLVSVIGTKADNLKHDLVYQWKSNWYKLTLHYEAQTVLPPPLNMLELLKRLIQHCRTRKGQDQIDAHIPESPTQSNLRRYLREAVTTSKVNFDK